MVAYTLALGGESTGRENLGSQGGLTHPLRDVTSTRIVHNRRGDELPVHMSAEPPHRAKVLHIDFDSAKHGHIDFGEQNDDGSVEVERPEW